MESRIQIRSLDAVPTQPFWAGAGVEGSAQAQTQALMDAAHSLCLKVHTLPPDSWLTLNAPRVDHLFFVWKGSLKLRAPTCSEDRVDQDQVVVVEHGGLAKFIAGPQGATLAHFHQSEQAALMTRRAGGQVHVAPLSGLFERNDPARRAVHTVWADAHCPTCELWLHRSKFSMERAQGEPHLHNEDEIIFVIEGGIKVGKVHGPGTAIAVAEGSPYTFGVGPAGGSFINFRATNPLVKMMSDGKPIGDWVSERAFMRNELDVPVIDSKAQLPKEVGDSGRP